MVPEGVDEEGDKRKMKLSKRLKHRFILTLLVLLISFFTLVMVTFAWYIFQTGARTSDIHMAVGTGSMLQISDRYDGNYGFTALLDKFSGRLNPVSTNRITGGFQKVTGYTRGTGEQSRLLASIFGAGDSNDYYKTTLFLRLSGVKQKVYLANISYEDAEPLNPISTAIRIGFVIHEAGKDQPVNSEYIFAINTGDNPKADYNTATGKEGYVLDCTRTDGTTIPMTGLYTSDNFCVYDPVSGNVLLKDTSLPLFELEGAKDGGFGEPVQVDVYIWLEGCDKDCANNLCNTMMKDIALSFASK